MAEPAIDQLQREDTNIEIIWRAYELRPEPVPTLAPQGEYLQRVWNSSVYPLAAKLGMKLKLPPVQPRSRLAHRAAHWARGPGRLEDFNRAIFRAFFERGEDIGQVTILIALANELKMDSEQLRLALTSSDHEVTVIADEQEAAQMGITGVPAFIANRQVALTGLQPIENLRRLVAQTRG